MSFTWNTRSFSIVDEIYEQGDKYGCISYELRKTGENLNYRLPMVERTTELTKKCQDKEDLSSDIYLITALTIILLLQHISLEGETDLFMTLTTPL